MKKLLTIALALVVLATFTGLSNAQRQPGPGVSVPLPGHNLTVKVLSACPSAVVKNIPPWLPPAGRINCSSSGGPDCSEVNIPVGTTIRLSSAPLFPTGSWSGNLGPLVTGGTCGYSTPNVGHQDCEFKMPLHDVIVTVELPCPPPPATSCQDDLNSGKLTITGPAASNITPTSANLSGSIAVSPMPPGCSYTAKLVWGQLPSFPTTSNTLATGTIPPPGPLTLSGTAQPLSPSSTYGARIEVTKQCGGLTPSVCNGRTKFIETPKPPCKDVTINLSTGQNPNWTVSPGTVGVTSPFSGYWVAPAGGASWIQPANSPTPQLFYPGNYQYRVPFTLPAPLSQYSSITITGQYAADNRVEFFLNGLTTGVLCTGTTCFQSWHQLSITSGFATNNTLNTLDAKVYNNPASLGTITETGLIVNATLSAICNKP